MGRRSGDPLIAKRIYAAWTATGLTHKAVARRLPGRDERYVYEATKGIRGVRPSDLLPLAQALGVRVGVLLGENHPDEPSQFVQRIGVLEHYLDYRACQTVLGMAELEAGKHEDWAHRGRERRLATEQPASYEVSDEEEPIRESLG